MNVVLTGKLIGRYYDENGEQTTERYNLKERVEIAIKGDLNEEKKKIKFPPCNIEWKAESGTKVWCSKNRYFIMH